MASTEKHATDERDEHASKQNDHTNDDKDRPPKTKKTKLVTSDLEALRLGGVYIPPFKMRRIEAKLAENKKSEAYQRLQWEALRKSINGPINKVNRHNIAEIVVELFNENIIRGRGLLCRCVMKAQMSSPSFTNVYCALLCIVNTKMPEIGDLLCRRVINQFQRAYKRNDKLSLKCIVTFVAHLINYQVLHELSGLKIIQLLLTSPTNDSIEIVKELILNCGATLVKLAPNAMKVIFNTLKDILQESTELDIRVQYELESLFQAFKTNFKDFPAIDEELDLVDEDDVICHNIDLLSKHDTEQMLDIFHYDPEWDAHERDYGEIKHEILGKDSSDDDDDDDEDEVSDNDSDDDDDADVEEHGDGDGAGVGEADAGNRDVEIADLTNESVMALRRNIYLTIVSSLSSEEMAHKILKKFPTQFKNVSHMILEACAHERSYRKQYGLLAEIVCKLKSEYEDCFDELFARQYSDIHLLDCNKIRNVSRFFAYLLCSHALDWTVMEFIKLNERDTNPSKRIFIKILFQEMSSFMGQQLKQRLFDANYGTAFSGLFPMGADASPKDTRFSINFFTTIGLGGLTQEMRAFLKEKHKEMIAQQQMESSSDDEDGDEEDSSDSSDSDSDSDSSTSSSPSVTRASPSDVDSENEEKRERKKTRTRTRSRSKSQRTETRDKKEKTKKRKSNSRSKSRSRSRSRSRHDRNKKHRKDRKDGRDDERERVHKRKEKRLRRSRSRSSNRSASPGRWGASR